MSDLFMSNPMKVSLLSTTKDAILTLYFVWRASREQCSIEEIADTIDKEKMNSIFQDIVKMSIPVAEFVDFVFLIEGMSIAFREQLVRSRTNAYWLSSGRVADHSRHYDDRMFRIPKSVADLGESPNEDDRKLYDVYLAHHKSAQSLYNDLVEKGLPRQDAREHYGLNTLHRGSMKINMRALVDMLKRRSCWIAQFELWFPFVRDVKRELLKEFGPVANHMFGIPCLHQNSFSGCKFGLENKRRLSGEDPLPACPRWFYNERKRGLGIGVVVGEWANHNESKDPDLPQIMTDAYQELWDMNLFTGAPLGTFNGPA